MAMESNTSATLSKEKGLNVVFTALPRETDAVSDAIPQCFGIS